MSDQPETPSWQKCSGCRPPGSFNPRHDGSPNCKSGSIASGGNTEKARVRVALNMLKDDYEELKQLAEQEGVSISGYLRKALATERYLKERTGSGGKILIEENGVQREIVFR